MRRIYQISVALICFVSGFSGALAILPKAITWYALREVSGQGVYINEWVFEPRITSASRSIVQPGPDIVYTACVYDLSDHPVEITIPEYDEYVSVSVFDDVGRNVFTIGDRDLHPPIRLLLVNRASPNSQSTGAVIVPTTQRGIVFERRIASTAEEFQKADRARRQSQCRISP
jgi:uncharacterized membrane protein